MGPVYEDAFNLLCGKLLGQGIHRKVFECAIRGDLVVKVEDNGDAYRRSFANVREFDFWGYWQEYEPVAKWLAPCKYLSPDGRIMLQRRCDPLPATYPLPEKLPAFLTDHKAANFGLLNDQLVCVDYAMVIYAANTKLCKAKYHG